MPRILIFKETLLPLSETFILAQTSSLTSFDPQFIGLEAVPGGLRLPHDPLLLSGEMSRLASLRAKLYRRLHWATRFHRGARSVRPALIHAHFASGGKTALSLARTLGVPLIVTFHGADITTAEAKATDYAPLRRGGALFLCVSDFIRRRALELGFPGAKLVTHYIGVDRALFSPAVGAAKREGVLFVGRLVEKKGCEYLLRAMKRVQQQQPDASLTVIGEGPLRSSLELLARSLHLRCAFLGSQPSTFVRESLSRARVFCVPSITASNGDSEGLGIVFAEAQAMGVPVVSTLHGGIPEVVLNGETGLLVRERDHVSLAAAICRLLKDNTLWDHFHNSAPQHVATHFDLHRQTAILEDHYRHLLAA